MARRIRLDLMDANHTPQTGNGTAQIGIPSNAAG